MDAGRIGQNGFIRIFPAYTYGHSTFSGAGRTGYYRISFPESRGNLFQTSRLHGKKSGAYIVVDDMGVLNVSGSAFCRVYTEAIHITGPIIEVGA